MAVCILYIYIHICFMYMCVNFLLSLLSPISFLLCCSFLICIILSSYIVIPLFLPTPSCPPKNSTTRNSGLAFVRHF
ncbi:hypothetical protein PUN28_014673 [Cardiocondyla obscurior]|uniref:Uncharacterized protein n=1 Tax=Cardiocondyla obscurior TaxID=286306 RepID=A0AAW2EUU9_9HYME